MSKTKIVVLDGARTPIGSFGGVFKDVPGVELGATAVRGALARAGVDATDIAEVVMGCIGQVGPDAYNARRVAIAAGLPFHVPAYTVNRLCGSGLQAVWSAAMEMLWNDLDFTLAGGPGNDVYYKGALMLHTLRGLIGDDAFFRATREILYGTDAPRPGNFKPRYASTNGFIGIVNRVTGQDHGWFFDVYLRSAQLPELLATRDATGLSLRWKTQDDKPFPLPVQVRVGRRDIEVAMTGGRGHVDVPAGASWTLDPHSRVLRALPHIVEFQKDAAERAKAAAAAARKQ